MRKKNLLLFITALIWGFNYVMQHSAMRHVSPYFFSFLRYLIGSLTVLIIIIITKRTNKENFHFKPIIISGIVLSCATISQQIGLQYTLPGKASFIGCFYIVVVPILSFLFYKEKPTLKSWLCVLICIVGIYFLTVSSNFNIDYSDLILVFSSTCYGVQIILIDKYTETEEPFKFILGQLVIVTLVSLLMTLFSEEGFSITEPIKFLPMVLYAGILSTGVSFLTQAFGQTDNDPTVASLIMSLESPFAVIFGFLLLNEIFTLREGFGCILIVIAIIILELKPKGKKND